MKAPHDRYCFCTDCCEKRQCGHGEDEPDYDEWRRAFPELPWDEEGNDDGIE